MVNIQKFPRWKSILRYGGAETMILDIVNIANAAAHE